MSYAEMFLLAWAVLATVLYVVSRHNAMFFKAHTLFKLKLVAEGKAKVISTDEYVTIQINKEQ